MPQNSLALERLGAIPACSSFGAFADRGREDYLGAHEFMVLATEFPDAKAEHWLMRAQYASMVDAWADALHWP